MEIRWTGALRRPLAVVAVVGATLAAILVPTVLIDRDPGPADRRPAAGEYPVLPSAAKPAGTTLPNGLSVPAGTVLVGEVFPFREPTSWRPAGL